MYLTSQLALLAVVAVCFFDTTNSHERADDGFVEISREKRQTTGPEDCGGYYTAPTGYFHTPGYPVNYLDNTECEWHIKVSPPYVKIQFEFVPMLSLHSFLAEGGERYCFDQVRVHDGDSANATFTRWCGHGIAPPTISTTDSLYVKFISDAYATDHRGFMAVYTGLTADNTTECVDLEKMEHSMMMAKS